MKRFLTFCIVLTAFCCMALAKPYSVKSLPVKATYVDSLDFNHVSNPDMLLTQQEQASINATLYSLEKRQGVQALVIVVKEINTDDAYEFAMGIARKYGVGNKQNTGIVILVVTESHDWRIITGEGMEKFLTDAQCSKIGRLRMVPYFKESQWGNGVAACVNCIDSICKGEVELTNIVGESEEDDGFPLWVLVVGIIIIVALCWYGSSSASYSPKCPYCKKSKGYKLVSRVVSDNKDIPDNLRQIEDTYHCSECGKDYLKKYKGAKSRYRVGTYDGSGKNDLAWGIIGAIGVGAAVMYPKVNTRRRRSGGSGSSSSWSSGSSSSSSSSSSFGGGSFGGGGAGGKW